MGGSRPTLYLSFRPARKVGVVVEVALVAPRGRFLGTETWWFRLTTQSPMNRFPILSETGIGCLDQGLAALADSGAGAHLIGRVGEGELPRRIGKAERTAGPGMAERIRVGAHRHV